MIIHDLKNKLVTNCHRKILNQIKIEKIKKILQIQYHATERVYNNVYCKISSEILSGIVPHG